MAVGRRARPGAHQKQQVPCLALGLGESSSEDSRPGFGGGDQGHDPARAGPDQPMKCKERRVCRKSHHPRANGGGEKEKRNVGRWGRARKGGAYPLRELIGEREEAWPASAQSEPHNSSFRKKGRGWKARALTLCSEENLKAMRALVQVIE